MTHSLRRLLAAALSPVPLGVAAVALAGILAVYGSPRAPAAAPTRGLAAVSTAARQPAAATGTIVMVDCLNKPQVRPSTFLLACADGNDVLTGMRWVNWASEAFAPGTEKINNCIPNCAAGTFISYPALITLWRPEPLPHHPGVRYFSRMTRIYTGNRPPLYDCHGPHTPPCHPLTATTALWSNLFG